MSKKELELLTKAFLALCIEEGVTFKRSLPFGYSGHFPFAKPEEEERYRDLFQAAITKCVEELADDES